jgi:hypothetical protein
LVTSVTASGLFTLASIRCDTFQFQDSIRFGLWRIENIDDGSCAYWHSTDTWVVLGRVASVVGHALGGLIVFYLSALLWSCGCYSSSSSSSSHHRQDYRTVLKQLMPTSLLTFWLLGSAIAIGMVGTVSLASTIVRSELCQGQCALRFSGLYCAAILWVATGVSLILIPLYTNGVASLPVGMYIESSTDHSAAWKNSSKNKHSGSATSNEDHTGSGNTADSTDHEEAGFAIVKTFHNGETHITETINEPDGTIRRTHIVKSPDGSQRVSARIYDDANGPYISDDDDDEEAAAVQHDLQQERIAGNEKIVQILLGDSPQDARPISTTIHWGVPSPHRVQPATFFQEPPLDVEAPAPLEQLASQSIISSESGAESLSFFPCHVPAMLNAEMNNPMVDNDVDDDEEEDDDDDDDDMFSHENGSIPSTIAFNKPPPPGDGESAATSSTPYGPRLLPEPLASRHDVV